MGQSKQESTYLHFELFNFIFLEKFKILWKIDYQTIHGEYLFAMKIPKK